MIYFHLSIDDVQSSILELSRIRAGLFNNNFFAWLNKLHNNYGCMISLYLQNWFQLKKIDDNKFPEFKENARWLKFGIHTTGDGNDFQKATLYQGKSEWEGLVNEILRIGGSIENIDCFPRLHMFAGSFECLSGMKSASICPALGFLAADDLRQSYYFDQAVNKLIYSKRCSIFDNKSGLYFIPTDFRFDWLGREFKNNNLYIPAKSRNCYKELERRYVNLSAKAERKLVTLFTHEWQIYSKGKIGKRKKWMEDACKFANRYGIGYEYPMNTLSIDSSYVISD